MIGRHRLTATFEDPDARVIHAKHAPHAIQKYAEMVAGRDN